MVVVAGASLILRGRLRSSASFRLWVDDRLRNMLIEGVEFDGLAGDDETLTLAALGLGVCLGTMAAVENTAADACSDLLVPDDAICGSGASSSVSTVVSSSSCALEMACMPGRVSLPVFSHPSKSTALLKAMFAQGVAGLSRVGLVREMARNVSQVFVSNQSELSDRKELNEHRCRHRVIRANQ